jgi:hypothetical protein
VPKADLINLSGLVTYGCEGTELRLKLKREWETHMRERIETHMRERIETYMRERELKHIWERIETRMRENEREVKHIWERERERNNGTNSRLSHITKVTHASQEICASLHSMYLEMDQKWHLCC